jgi:non-specific serine/threonine protein kinase
VAAYECYLRANSEIWRFKEDALDRAVQDLQNALDITGPNPLLYSAMAGAYFQYVNIGARQEDYLARAEENAKKALAIDPDFSKANVVLGYIYQMTNQREGIRYFKKALVVNPNELDALRRLVLIYLDVGKPSAALPLIERYKKADPLNPDNYLLQGYFYIYDGQFGLALDPCRKWYQSDPENPIKEFLYALSLAYTKAFEKAFSIIEKCAKADPDNAVSKFGLLLKYGLQKDRENAFKIMTPDFRKTCLRDWEWSYYVADAFALLDEKKEALDWLENAVNRGFINYPFINSYDFFLENIRSEERFKKLMERVKYEWEHFDE